MPAARGLSLSLRILVRLIMHQDMGAMMGRELLNEESQAEHSRHSHEHSQGAPELAR